MRRVAVVLFVLLAACGGNSDKSSVTTTTSRPSQTTTTQPFTTGAQVTADRSPPSTLTDVSVGKHDGFVRVVFRFASAPPGYNVHAADPPFTMDGSGREIAVGGNGHLAVRLAGANGHDDAGRATVGTARIAGPAGTSVSEIVFAGDFEGVVNYVIGTTTAEPFRVFWLEDPGRVVVDIQSP